MWRRSSAHSHHRSKALAECRAASAVLAGVPAVRKATKSYTGQQPGRVPRRAPAAASCLRLEGGRSVARGRERAA